MRQHFIRFKVPGSSVLSYDRPAGMEKYLIDSDLVRVHRDATKNPVRIEMTVFWAVINTCTFPKLRSMRPTSGKMLGQNFTERYNLDIDKIVYARVDDKGRMEDSAQMIEHLKVFYPDRFDLSSTHHIGNVCDNLFEEASHSSCNKSRTRDISESTIYYSQRVFGTIGRTCCSE